MDSDVVTGVTFAGLFALWGMFICGILVISIGIKILICWYLSSCLEKIPPRFRRQEPGMVWLLLIPLFTFVWAFFVYPKIADSFKAYFDSVGRTDVGDCGRDLALIYCILAVIPYVGLAALILLILVLVKFDALKKQIPSGLPPAV